MMKGRYKRIRSFTVEDGRFRVKPSELLVEIPLEIIINESRNMVIMCTPGMTQELVTGFLFTESLINDPRDILDHRIASTAKEEGETVIEARVRISNLEDAMSVLPKRVSYSSCGICGKENYYEFKQGVGRVKSRHRFSMPLLKDLPGKLAKLQALYRRTGGSHAAVLFDAAGDPVVHSEDMGRHNALDKVIGFVLLNGIQTEDKVLVSSGRGSLEMILKAARAKIPVFLAMSRPTSRAVEAAKFYNITLIDMAKGTNRIYSHARRIQGF